jgi:hypothetical protein
MKITKTAIGDKWAPKTAILGDFDQEKSEKILAKINILLFRQN